MLDSIKTRLTEIKDNFSDIQTKLSMPDVINDQKQYASLSKEYSNLKPIVEKFEEYIQCESNISSAEEVLNESDMDLAELAKEEIKETPKTQQNFQPVIKNIFTKHIKRGCEWPKGHPDESDFKFCGKDRFEDKPYCLEHCAVAYVIPEKEETEKQQITQSI